jgi:hypothetical protein
LSNSLELYGKYHYDYRESNLIKFNQSIKPNVTDIPTSLNVPAMIKRTSDPKFFIITTFNIDERKYDSLMKYLINGFMLDLKQDIEIVTKYNVDKLSYDDLLKVMVCLYKEDINTQLLIDFVNYTR